MSHTEDFQYFEGDSFSELYGPDLEEYRYAFMLSYPCTAAWARYPNTKKYFIQDGSVEEKKVDFNKIRKKEPWKNMAVLGNHIPGILTSRPPDVLLSYWREHFGFTYENMVFLPRDSYCEVLNEGGEYDKIITLFPYDHLLPERHAVDPDKHYHLLSKTALADMGVHYPLYQVFDFNQVRPEDVELQAEFPYLIKTSHGLSGEGTYIIRNEDDLNFCRQEVRNYLKSGLLDAVVVSDFVKNAVENYCVQFYVDKTGKPTLIGATNQLVTDTGVHLGGMIHFRETDMTKFFHKIAVISRFVHKHGYFGVIGVDVLEDVDGQLHMIDANIRVNGSTPLCLQRHTLLGLGKEAAKYSSDYRMFGTLDDVMVALRPDLDKKDLTILSALELTDGGKVFCDIYGIVAGETTDEMTAIEKRLEKKGLHIAS